MEQLVLKETYRCAYGTHVSCSAPDASPSSITVPVVTTRPPAQGGRQGYTCHIAVGDGAHAVTVCGGGDGCISTWRKDERTKEFRETVLGYHVGAVNALTFDCMFGMVGFVLSLGFA